MNRDRFVLSNGHACALLYTLLHLSGYADFPFEQLENFRQVDSKCAALDDIFCCLVCIFCCPFFMCLLLQVLFGLHSDSALL